MAFALRLRPPFCCPTIMFAFRLEQLAEIVSVYFARPKGKMVFGLDRVGFAPERVHSKVPRVV